MMCQPRVASGRPGMDRCACVSQGCGCGPSFRSFFSSQEKRERLESYKDQLQKELAAMEEILKELES